MRTLFLALMVAVFVEAGKLIMTARFGTGLKRLTKDYLHD